MTMYAVFVVAMPLKDNLVRRIRNINLKNKRGKNNHSTKNYMDREKCHCGSGVDVDYRNRWWAADKVEHTCCGICWDNCQKPYKDKGETRFTVDNSPNPAGLMSALTTL
jgi:hypothetical protein